jgi:hypothetical protein
MTPSPELVSLKVSPCVWIHHLPFALKSADGLYTHSGYELVTQLHDEDEISLETVDDCSLQIRIFEDPDSFAARPALVAEVRRLLEMSCEKACQYESALVKIASDDMV